MLSQPYLLGMDLQLPECQLHQYLQQLRHEQRLHHQKYREKTDQKQFFLNVFTSRTQSSELQIFELFGSKMKRRILDHNHIDFNMFINISMKLYDQKYYVK